MLLPVMIAVKLVVVVCIVCSRAVFIHVESPAPGGPGVVSWRAGLLWVAGGTVVVWVRVGLLSS